MNYQLIDGKVTSDDGKIAVQHVNTNGANISVDGTPYTFTPKHNVSLAWIAPEHLDRVLAADGSGCNCGGVKKKKFSLSSTINTNLHVYGNREGAQ